MWHKKVKEIFKKWKYTSLFLITSLCLGAVLLASCGASSANMATSAPAKAPMGANDSSTGSSSGNSGSGTSKTGSSSGATQYGPQYLIKSLQITMEVKDTRQTASDLQKWMSSSDPQATSNGLDYQQYGSNQYIVTLTYLVDVEHYLQVQQYLSNYASQDGRTLISLNEKVQDVTSDYIDTEARLTNLRTEQQRLLAFLKQAKDVNDLVSIEQQLTQVEGQINDIQAHLNALKGQTTYYTVTITLQPKGTTQPDPAPTPWSVIPVWQGAWDAVVSVWQGFATVLVWLIAFSVYIIPAVLLIWLVRKRPWRKTRAIAAAPLSHSPTESEPK